MALKSKEKAPLTRHPLFPALAALWCAALLGIGSLAIRVTVLENAVLRLGLDSLIPAAAPPLGFTARMLLALALGIAGAVAGFVLARRMALAAGGPLLASDAEPDLAGNPRAEVGESAGADDNDDLARLEAARPAQPGRRRALTSESALTPHTPAILHLGELDDLDTAAEPDSPASTAAPADEPASQPDDPAPTPAPEPILSAPAVQPPPLTARSGQALRAARLDTLGVADLANRFALALESRRSAPSPAPLAPAPAATQPLPQPAPLPFADDDLLNPEPEGGRPFDMPAAMRQPGLGHVEWFGDEEYGDDEDEALAAETLESLLPPKRPAAADPLRALAFGSLAESTALPPDIAAEAARWALPEPDDEIDEDALLDEPDDDPLAPTAADEPFSSLLDMKPSPRNLVPPLAPFVRVEDEPAGNVAEPVVTFPGQAVPAPPIPARLPGTPFGATPVETEAALRDALAALQKMSGAA